MKVFELAKKLEVKSVFLMDKIKRQWHLPVKSHMDNLSPEMAKRIEKRFHSDQKKKQAKKTQKKSSPQATKSSVNIIKKTSTTKKQTPSKKTKKTTVKTRATKLKTKAVKKPLKGQHPVASAQKTTDPLVEEQTAKPPQIKRRMIIRRRAEEAPPSKAPQPQITKNTEKSEPTPNDRASVGKTKNIRLDLVSVKNDDFLEDDPQDKNQEINKPKKQPKKSSVEKDTPSKFNATDFRKREMIFQPRKKRTLAGGGKKTKITTPKSHKRIVKVYGEMSFEKLCQTMGLKKQTVLKKLKEEGINIKEKNLLDFETIALTVPAFGWTAQNTKHTEKELLDQMNSQKSKGKQPLEKPKPPVVTVMGHVDHGKTTLLDSIRKTDTVKKEAGGITQHIGAYTVPIGDSFITFIDTPGHAAFTAMRSRGASVTDVVVIVVSATDGVMPQTVEALNHAQAAQIPIVVAVNKMDAPGADIEKIKKQMSEQKIVAEDWGGDTGFIPVSALKLTGIKELLEHIRLVAEMRELKCQPSAPAIGTALEARIEKGIGPVVSLLLKDGTLKRGDLVLAGHCKGRIRQIKDDQGRWLTSAGPSQPVKVMGFEDLPTAGAPFYVVKNEKAVKNLLAIKATETKIEDDKEISPEELLLKMTNDTKKTELSLVLKTDVKGSLEAIQNALQNIKSDELELKIIHSAAGGVTQSDVLLASAVQGVVIAFNVRPDPQAIKTAKDKEVEIYTHSVIYELLDQVKKLMLGLLKAETVEEELGRAETKEIFNISKKGVVAGCYVTEGQIPRNALVRLIRDGQLIHKGAIAGLRRFKEDVQKVTSGMECGISLEKFNDIKPKDTIEAYVQKELPRTEL